MSLLKYILKRILAAVPTLLGVMVITFLFTRLIPGDPVLYRLPFGRVTLEEIERERAHMGLDKPIIVQFFVYITDMLTGNWSFSFTVDANVPVWDLILDRLPRTLEFMFYSIFLAIFFGSRLGKISGANRNKSKDNFIRIFTYTLISIPAFVVVIFLMQLYVFTSFRIFPMSGYKNVLFEEPPTITYIRLLDCIISGKWYLAVDYLWHLAVPLSAMTLIQLVVITRQTRSSMIETLEEDYIYTARVKGCTEKDVINKHAFKNAVAPSIMVLSMGIPLILGGMIAVEKICDWVGMGILFFNAVNSLDYPVVIASVYVFAVVVIIVNIIADVLVAMLDPRIRLN